MPQFVETLITVLCAVLASSGFWALMQKLTDKKDAKHKCSLDLLMIEFYIWA